jgi:hypothetical protein
VGPVAVSRHFSSEVDPTGRFVWKAEEFRQYQADRTGALVHENLARLYGWKIGEVIPVTVPWLAKVDGTRVWNFTVRIFRWIAKPRQILSITNIWMKAARRVAAPSGSSWRS